ncbi:MAG TPA: hypothetical protein P5225_01720 [Candidatus Paceibacterota bacterium]|jgi:predicted PurR-regulated permease PerM|nr:hypothetical protein [Candidatus Paceibacterota bacterium]
MNKFFENLRNKPKETKELISRAILIIAIIFVIFVASLSLRPILSGQDFESQKLGNRATQFVSSSFSNLKESAGKAFDNLNSSSQNKNFSNFKNNFLNFFKFSNSPEFKPLPQETNPITLPIVE